MTFKPPTIWHKLNSSKRPMCYYYNIDTNESVWEEPIGATIIDKTGESTSNNPESNHSDEDYYEQLSNRVAHPEIPLNFPREISPKQASSKDTANYSLSRKMYSSGNLKRKASPTKDTTNDSLSRKMHNASGNLKIKASLTKGCVKKIKKDLECRPTDLPTKPHCSALLEEPKTFGFGGKIKKDPECRPTDLPTKPHCSALLEEQKTFDLRDKLRKNAQNVSPNNLKNEVEKMDWEDIDEDKFSLEVEQSKDIQQNDSVSPEFSKVYCVCDTNALLKDDKVVENVIVNGTLIGICVTIVIPFIVLSELDQIKNKEDIGYIARRIIRVIRSSQESPHLILQPGNSSREPVDSLEFRVNDDLVLNCCLQRKELCKSDELAVLITYDNNLANKSTSYKVTSHNWNSFKKWARGYREKQRCLSLNLSGEKQLIETSMPTKITISNTFDEENMDLGSTSNLSTSRVSPKKEFSRKDTNLDHTKICPDENAENSVARLIKLQTDDLKLDFQEFLHSVINKILDEEYEDKLKKMVNNIKPGWTLMDYILELRRRWYLLTLSFPSTEVQAIFSQLIAVVKKVNSGKEALNEHDILNFLHACTNVAKRLEKRYPKPTEIFFIRLDLLKEEWKEAQKSSSSVTPPTQNLQDVNPVDVALQNIYNCLKSDSEILEIEIEDGKKDNQKEMFELESSIDDFYSSTTNLVLALKNVLQEKHDTLRCDDDIITHLHELVTNFSSGRNTHLSFELSKENVVELFQDVAYRENVHKLLDKFIELKQQANKLLNIVQDWTS